MLDEPITFFEGENKCGKKGKPVDVIYLDFPKTFEDFMPKVIKYESPTPLCVVVNVRRSAVETNLLCPP